MTEQLGWKAPDHCVAPAASGELHTKIWKGIQEMRDIGLIDAAKTKMHLAQPEGSSPIVQAFEKGSSQVEPVKPDTIAKSLAIGNPASGPFSLQTLTETHGTAVAALEERGGDAGLDGAGGRVLRLVGAALPLAHVLAARLLADEA